MGPWRTSGLRTLLGSNVTPRPLIVQRAPGVRRGNLRRRTIVCASGPRTPGMLFAVITNTSANGVKRTTMQIAEHEASRFPEAGGRRLGIAPPSDERTISVVMGVFAPSPFGRADRPRR